MPLSAEVVAFLARHAQPDARPFHERSPEEMRAGVAAFVAAIGPGPAMAHVAEEALTSAGIDADGHPRAPAMGHALAARVLVPPGPVRGVLVYLHGGGWVMGHVDEYDTLCRKLAVRAGCVVVLPSYRLAPEFPFPAAADDACAVLAWAHACGPRWAGDRGAALPVVLVGDSAGANLATVAARRARDAGGPPVALQVLVYPVTDCDLDRASYRTPERQAFLTRDDMAAFWEHYLPDPAARAHPDASPLRTVDLTGLAPAVVITAEYDPLRDEGEAYAARLVHAGVPVTFRRFHDQAHGFFTLTNLLRSSDDGVDFIVDAIRTRLAEIERGRLR